MKTEDVLGFYFLNNFCIAGDEKTKKKIEKMSMNANKPPKNITFFKDQLLYFKKEYKQLHNFLLRLLKEVPYLMDSGSFFYGKFRLCIYLLFIDFLYHPKIVVFSKVF